MVSKACCRQPQAQHLRASAAARSIVTACSMLPWTVASVASGASMYPPSALIQQPMPSVYQCGTPHLATHGGHPDQLRELRAIRPGSALIQIKLVEIPSPLAGQQPPVCESQARLIPPGLTCRDHPVYQPVRVVSPDRVDLLLVSLKTDGSSHGQRDHGNGGGKPTFSDGQRGGFLNRSMSDRCRGSEAGAWIAPDGRAGRRPTHHPRGRIPRRRQAVGDRHGCRSSIP